MSVVAMEGNSRRSSEVLAERARATLAERLHARSSEIEQAAMTRLYGIAESGNPSDPEYSEGLRTAIAAALGYLLEGVERGEAWPSPPPAAVLVQARLAARRGISLDTVVRRCFAGYTLFCDFLVQEAEVGGLLQTAEIKCLLRAQATCFDCVLAAVTEEYAREAEAAPDSTEERRTERVRRLLVGERLGAAELEYDLGGRHLGAIARGPGSVDVLRVMASDLDLRLLAVQADEETVWAWVGARRELDLEEIERFVSSTWPSHLILAVGEPGQGQEGWRLTHQQAKAALPIAARTPGSIVRYADVALLASAIHDELLATSLRQLYLVPLEAGRDGGEALRQTLRAYFMAERNASSAAAAIGVDRSTVTNRLRAIEAKIGRSLSDCAAEMEVALRWNELDQTSSR
jgi:PucR C-terminal helix-turn-helix domain/GGDEF-like domain